MELTRKQYHFLNKLPQFDPTWSTEVQEKWFTSVKKVMTMPQENEWMEWACLPLKGGRKLQINVFGKITSTEDIDHIIEGLRITRECFDEVTAPKEGGDK